MFCYNSFNMNFFAADILSFCPWKGASFLPHTLVQQIASSQEGS